MSSCTEGCFRNVINLGNSIIGVSILAMPYCFQKCGILLSLVLIMASGLMTKASCHLLLKAAIMARRRNFEFLAFHTFGTWGKFAVELSIIGFLLGTCIAFFVVIGDLSPPLAAELFLLESSVRLRVEVLLFLGFFIALPLGLLRKVESLTSFSFLSVCFYIFLGLKILAESLPNISSDVLWNQLHWWRPSGLLSTLPIFFMALSCQTQLFEIFDTLNDPSLKRMDTVVSSAVHMCSGVYSLVGIFGYIAFYDQNISGNILVKLSNSGLTEVVKIAFVVTVIISFPLCLFPCRSSLHSLIYKQGVTLHEMPGSLQIPDHRFRALTFVLVASTICAAILLPDIEFVLGILGSTIGTVICFILPALIFIKNTMKNTNERILAQVVFCIGVFILVACSYSTLHEPKSPDDMLPVEPLASQLVPQERPKPFLPKGSSDSVIAQQNINAKNIEEKFNMPVNEIPEKRVSKEKPIEKMPVSPQPEKIEPALEKRQEPPVPQEPDDLKQSENNKKDDVVVVVQNKVEEEEKSKNIVEESRVKADVQAEDNKFSTEKFQLDNNQNDLHPDAIKKEDKEIGKKKSKEDSKILEDDGKADKQEELLRKIEAQQKEQKKLLEEQRQLLQELKEHKESHVVKPSGSPPQKQVQVPEQQAQLPQQPRQFPQPPEQLPQQPGQLPQQPGQLPQQPGQLPQQPGQLPQQPGQLPQQPGQLPQQPGQLPQQPGQLPQQPGQLPQQPGQLPQQPGQLPQQPGQFPQQSEQLSKQQGDLPQQAGQAPQQPGQAAQQVGKAAQQAGQAAQQAGQAGQAAQQAGQAAQQAGQAAQQAGQAAQQAGQAPEQAGQAAQQAGQAAKQPGHAPQQPGQDPQQPGQAPQRPLQPPQEPIIKLKEAESNLGKHYMNQKPNQVNIPKFLPQVSPRMPPNEEIPLSKRMSEGLDGTMVKDKENAYNLQDRKEKLIKESPEKWSNQQKNVRVPLKQTSLNLSQNSDPELSHIENDFPLDRNVKKIVPNISA